MYGCTCVQISEIWQFVKKSISQSGHARESWDTIFQQMVQLRQKTLSGLNSFWYIFGQVVRKLPTYLRRRTCRRRRRWGQKTDGSGDRPCQYLRPFLSLSLLKLTAHFYLLEERKEWENNSSQSNLTMSGRTEGKDKHSPVCAAGWLLLQRECVDHNNKWVAVAMVVLNEAHFFKLDSLLRI